LKRGFAAEIGHGSPYGFFKLCQANISQRLIAYSSGSPVQRPKKTGLSFMQSSGQ
jgi:hypothetical protein